MPNGVTKLGSSEVMIDNMQHKSNEIKANV